ncbi:MAG: sulfur carrier protein ThiS adenylyltransferase ThiF [Thermodesulfobacteriota bacterium]
MRKIRVLVNEDPVELDEGTSLRAVKERFKPQADLVIHNRFPQAADPLLEDGDQVVLIKKGEVPSAHELEALMVARHSPGVHQKVKAARVGIAGLGGLGSAVAVALARVGVGTLVIADFDVVEPSNLNRQQYFVDQIGMSKVQAMRENLARINPYVRVEGHEAVLDRQNVPAIFASTPIIVEAFDRAEMKEMLITTVLEKMPGHTVVAASGLAGYGPSNTIRTESISPQLYIVGDQVSAATPGCGLMAPRVGIAAHHQANLVLRLILGEEGGSQRQEGIYGHP